MLRTWLPTEAQRTLAAVRRVEADSPQAMSIEAARLLEAFTVSLDEFLRRVVRAAAPALPRFLSAHSARPERTTTGGFDPDEGGDDETEVDDPLEGVDDAFLLLFLWLMLWGGVDHEQRRREWLQRRQMDLLTTLRAAWAQAAGEADREAGRAAAKAELRRQARPDGPLGQYVSAYARTEFWIGVNAALRAVAERNADAFAGYRWTAVLDERTCVRCAAMDGRFFPLEDPPRIPLHPRCRCLAVPVASRRSEAPPRGQSFGDWLRRQPADLQRELLGPDAEAFAAGRKAIGDYVSFRGRYAARRREP